MCGPLLWVGYSRRKPFWTARSWRNFVIALGSAVGAVSLSLVMAYGIDAGVYDSLSPSAGDLYFFFMLALVVGATFAIPLLLTWFAASEPSEQFDWRNGEVNICESDDRGTAEQGAAGDVRPGIVPE